MPVISQHPLFIGAWRFSIDPGKDLREGAGIAKAYLGCNFIGFHICRNQEGYRMAQTYAVYIVLEIFSRVFLKEAAEIIGIHVYLSCQHLQSEIFPVMGFDIFLCPDQIFLLAVLHGIF